MGRKGWAGNLQLAGIYLLVIIIVVIFLLPIYSMLTISFKLPSEVVKMPPVLFSNLTLANYKTVLFGEKLEGTNLISGADVSFAKALLNSLFVGLSATGLALLLGVPPAYVLARFEFKRKRDVALFILSTRFAPPLAVLIPYYIAFSRLRLLDTHIALIAMYTVMNLSMVVWMMMGFFKELPREIEDAALVDGCTRLAALRYITLPLVAPGVAATTIFVMMMSWNEFAFAVFLTSTVARTAPVAVLAYIRYMHVAWGPLAAAGTVISLPVIAFVLIFQQRLVRGLTLGAIHG